MEYLIEMRIADSGRSTTPTDGVVPRGCQPPRRCCTRFRWCVMNFVALRILIDEIAVNKALGGGWTLE